MLEAEGKIVMAVAVGRGSSPFVGEMEVSISFDKELTRVIERFQRLRFSCLKF